MLTKNSWLTSLIIVLIVVLAACSAAPETAELIPAQTSEEPVAGVVVAPTDVIDVNETMVEPTAVFVSQPEVEAEVVEPEDVVETAVMPVLATTSLSDTEIAALQFMREEEKLARDLYLALYAQWGLPIFQNIAGSEQTHVDAVLGLMQRYEVADTAANLGSGQFANADLQALYDQLLASGSQSMADALRVGALVEETDIVDLESRLANLQNGEVSQAFNNLYQGSLNHLRSFAGMLERQTGEVYQPQILAADVYADILAGSSGFSGQMSGQGQGQGNSGGQGNSQGNGNGQRGNGQGGNGSGNGRS